MSEVTTSTMASANGTSSNTPPVSEGSTTGDAPTEAPKRRKRGANKAKTKEKTPPTKEQFQLVGQLTYEAHKQELELTAYVDRMRSDVEAYDAVFGES